MKTEIENAINAVLADIKTGVDATDALKLSQSALNLAHTQQVLRQTEVSK